MPTIEDYKAQLKKLADSDRYYGRWNSTTGNGKWNVPAGMEAYPPTFDCGVAATYALYKALGWNWNSGTTCAYKGYIWPDNEGTSSHEWFLINVLGAKKYSYSELGYNGLKDGDVLDTKSHIYVLYDKDAGTIFEANDGYSSIKSKQIDIHGWINYGPVWVYRLPWEQGVAPDPDPGESKCEKLFELGQLWDLKEGDDAELIWNAKVLFNIQFGDKHMLSTTFDKTFADAVENFNKVNGLGSRRTFNAKTWANLLCYYGNQPGKDVGCTAIWPVNLGDQNELTKNVQALLNAKTGAGMPIDGDYGTVTAAAVLKFNKAHGCGDTSSVTPNTWFNLLCYKD